MNNHSADNASFEQYIDDLIDQKGYPNLTPEVREELRNDLKVRVDDFIMARVIAALSDEDLTTFETMLKEKKPREELQKFAADHTTDFTSFLTNVLIEFQGVYLASSPGTAQ